MTTVFKKGEKECKNNYKPVRFCQMYQKYLKDVCLDKYQTIWTINYQNVSADLEKVIAHKIVFCTCLADRSAQWIMERYLDYCIQTYLKCLIVFPMNV